jgi:hypothetical protein
LNESYPFFFACIKYLKQSDSMQVSVWNHPIRTFTLLSNVLRFTLTHFLKSFTFNHHEDAFHFVGCPSSYDHLVACQKHHVWE